MNTIAQIIVENWKIGNIHIDTGNIALEDAITIVNSMNDYDRVMGLIKFNRTRLCEINYSHGRTIEIQKIYHGGARFFFPYACKGRYVPISTADDYTLRVHMGLYTWAKMQYPESCEGENGSRMFRAYPLAAAREYLRRYPFISDAPTQWSWSIAKWTVGRV